MTYHYFEVASRELGIACRLVGDVLQFEDKQLTRRIWGLWVDLDSMGTARIAGDKSLCSGLLRERGMPVPSFTAFIVDEATLQSMPLPNAPRWLVVKPARGTSSGRGITLRLAVNDAWGRMWAIVKAGLWSDMIHVEEFVEGDSFRFLVCKGQVLSVVHRGASLLGDGTSTVSQLVSRENRARRELIDQAPRGARPVKDLLTVVPHNLSYQGLHRRSIPGAGQRVPAFGAYHCPATPDSDTDVTAIAHEDLVQLAIDAASAVGINLCGVDMICKDITRDRVAGGAVINEVNTSPALWDHHDIPNAQNVCLAVLKAMFDR
ncbi:hypothetical protein [Ideonella sp. A 288]|uniref:hypothetical protein n=1 Tax=Ideonella sp. A 288 TaxID=1962181 RepID=UPI0011865E76|nr:hypothetical protein [Ideonella sp. A 288]